MSRAVLITGGAGFIAGNLTHHWCAAYPQDRVVVLNALTYAGNLATIQPLHDPAPDRWGRIHFVQGDISDRALVDGLLVEEAISHVAHPRGRKLCGSLDHGPGGVLGHQRDRHLHAAGGVPGPLAAGRPA